MNTGSLKNFGKRGFSLVEMLVVIAVIGLIAAIALPQYSSINSAAKLATARRNAQNIAMISNSANAAGAFHVVPESMGGGIEMSVDILTKGVKSEVFDLTYKIELSEAEIKNAADYLSIVEMSGEYLLIYNAE